jgi:hypothetical protein
MNTDDEGADELDDDERTTGLVQAAMPRPTQPAGIGSGSAVSTEDGHRLEDAPKFEPLISRLFGLCQIHHVPMAAVLALLLPRGPEGSRVQGDSRPHGSAEALTARALLERGCSAVTCGIPCAAPSRSD